MGFTQILILMQVCRLWNLPLCNHCTPVCTKLSHVSNETLYLFSTNIEGTCTSLSLAGHGSAMGFSLRKGRKRYLKVNHGWPWLVNKPWLTMVDHGLAKLFQTIVNHGWPWFGKAFLNHGQPWSTVGLWNGTSVNHGCPWLAKVLSTMVNHG